MKKQYEKKIEKNSLQKIYIFGIAASGGFRYVRFGFLFAFSCRRQNITQYTIIIKWISRGERPHNATAFRIHVIHIEWNGVNGQYIARWTKMLYTACTVL